MLRFRRHESSAPWERTGRSHRFLAVPYFATAFLLLAQQRGNKANTARQVTCDDICLKFLHMFQRFPKHPVAGCPWVTIRTAPNIRSAGGKPPGSLCSLRNMERLSAGAQCHCSLVEAQWHTRSGKATSLGDDFDSCFGVHAKLLRRNMQCLFFAFSEVSRGVFSS